MVKTKSPISQIQLRFPTQGLNRRFAYSTQPPNTTPACMNVRPYDTAGASGTGDVTIGGEGYPKGRERGGSRPGLRKAFDFPIGGGGNVQMLSDFVDIDANRAIVHTLLAVGNAVVYEIRGDGSFTTSGSYLELLTEDGVNLQDESGNNLIMLTNSLNADLPTIEGAKVGRNFYFADYGPMRAEDQDGTVNAGNLLTSTMVHDFTTIGIDITSDMVVIAFKDGTRTDSGSYPIASVSSAGLTIGGNVLPPGECLFTIARPPKVYSDGVVENLVPSAGLVPIGCTLACAYRQRLVLGGGGTTWYMSRATDPTDWDYFADPDDMARAVAGTTTTVGGTGDPQTALMPHSDDYLLVGCENSLWVFRGDPAVGGQLDSLSHVIGVVGPRAWCSMADGSTMFLSRDGIYVLAAGGVGYPQPISRQILPYELLNVDAAKNVVTMVYDIEQRGVLLSITPVDGSAGSQWWLDLQTLGIYPYQYPDAMQPTSVIAYAPSLHTQRRVHFGSNDGYIRYVEPSEPDDDGILIESFVEIGPFRLGPLDHEGILTEIDAVVGELSDPVAWSIRAETTEELAVRSKRVRFSGIWKPGYDRPHHPRIRGCAAVLRLSALGAWAFEYANLKLLVQGRPR